MDNGDDKNGDQASQFAPQNTTADELLASSTVGLVNLSDFRKRKAEALEFKEREAREKTQSGRGMPAQSSGGSTPLDRSSTPRLPAKKKKKSATKGKLSFGLDEDEDTEATASSAATRNATPDPKAIGHSEETSADSPAAKARLGPNTSIANAPRAMTKAALTKDAELKEQLRKDFVVVQKNVKETEILVPFVFYDGTNIPGGKCKIKKGDPIWLFLDRARKVGAELGVGGSADKARREWARISVDDLMLVKGDIIIPPHYDFYYFIVNGTHGFQGLMFEYSDKPTSKTQSADTAEIQGGLSRPTQAKAISGESIVDDSALEGGNLDPEMTKVVDRRWYERNKHIYPASIWEEFDPTKDYTKGIRKDTEGNRFFF